MAHTINPYELHSHPPYSTPVLRPDSPASSIGTVNDVDRTAITDKILSQESFDQKVWEDLGFGNASESEEIANITPLIDPRPINPEEEELMLNRVMDKLRAEVQKVRDDEIYEEAILRGSQVGLEPQPSSNNIDAIMQSMMSVSSPAVPSLPSQLSNNNSAFSAPRPNTLSQNGVPFYDLGPPLWDLGEDARATSSPRPSVERAREEASQSRSRSGSQNQGQVERRSTRSTSGGSARARGRARGRAGATTRSRRS